MKSSPWRYALEYRAVRIASTLALWVVFTALFFGFVKILLEWGGSQLGESAERGLMIVAWIVGLAFLGTTFAAAYLLVAVGRALQAAYRTWRDVVLLRDVLAQQAVTSRPQTGSLVEERLDLLEQIHISSGTVLGRAPRSTLDPVRDAARVPALDVAAAMMPPARALELHSRVTRQSTLEDFETLVERLFRMKWQVCRIERIRDDLPPGPGGQHTTTAIGTGFLIGADRVLTCRHVVEDEHDPALHSKIICRFDYVRAESSAKLVTLASDWLVVSNAEADLAEIRLAEPVGSEPPMPDANGSAERGWIKIQPGSGPEGGTAIVVQHPLGMTMQIAFGSWKALPGGCAVRPDRFVAHDGTTLSGSSGSPCIDASGRLVAVHRGSCACQHAPVNVATIALASALQASRDRSSAERPEHEIAQVG